MQIRVDLVFPLKYHEKMNAFKKEVIQENNKKKYKSNYIFVLSNCIIIADSVYFPYTIPRG